DIAGAESICVRQSIKNMMITGKIIAASALKRQESRGGHFRTDFPETDPAMAKRSYTTLKDVDAIAAEALETA
ncbi:MAG: L-aspartate oxidase, partial [Pseudomonadota bacterium]